MRIVAIRSLVRDRMLAVTLRRFLRLHRPRLLQVQARVSLSRSTAKPIVLRRLLRPRRPQFSSFRLEKLLLRSSHPLPLLYRTCPHPRGPLAPRSNAPIRSLPPSGARSLLCHLPRLSLLLLPLLLPRLLLLPRSHFLFLLPCQHPLHLSRHRSGREQRLHQCNSNWKQRHSLQQPPHQQHRRSRRNSRPQSSSRRELRVRRWWLCSLLCFFCCVYSPTGYSSTAYWIPLLFVDSLTSFA